LVSKGTVIYVAAFALLLFWAFFVQADTRRVDGYSMLPTLEGGDLVVIQNVPMDQIHVGDIVVYNGLCSVGGESVVHRVVSITAAGLITKGDNNPENDQASGIAFAPITSQCLEGKVIFVIPYVELLAYYIDSNGLPQWLNYIPSIIILIIVIVSIMGEEERDTGDKTARPRDEKVNLSIPQT
jgi:signal peptidase I